MKPKLIWQDEDNDGTVFEWQNSKYTLAVREGADKKWSAFAYNEATRWFKSFGYPSKDVAMCAAEEALRQELKPLMGVYELLSEGVTL